MAKWKVKTEIQVTVETIIPPESTSFSIKHPKWSGSLLFGILGAIVFYFLNPILVFGQATSTAYTVILSLCCAVLAFFLSTDLFAKYSSHILKIGFGCMLIQVMTNITLTYGWLPENILLMVIANSLSIPVAIIWFFLLKNFSYSKELATGVSSFREALSVRTFRIVGTVVLIMAGILIFYRLGFYDIWEDENPVINAAIGIREQGLAYLDEGYDRAWLHLYLISGLFDVFGVSEFTGRLPSAIFGMLFVGICFYVFVRWYGIWILAVLVPLVCLMNDRFLILFRYMLSNGLPLNSTLMMLFAGSGLFLSRIANSAKIVLGLTYLLIVLSLAAMVYLIEWEGQDYRYIVHIVPFVVGVSLFAWRDDYGVELFYFDEMMLAN